MLTVAIEQRQQYCLNWFPVNLTVIIPHAILYHTVHKIFWENSLTDYNVGSRSVFMSPLYST